MKRQPKHFYDFGPYRLDTVKRLLLKEGEPVPLTPKAFDTLLALVEDSGQVIEKEELIKRVWPDSFVEEGNLTVNVSMLRKALGESPNQHRYIVTVPGRGYRFVADVRELWDEGADLIVEEHTRSRVVIEHEEHDSAESEIRLDESPRLTPAAVRAFALRLSSSRRQLLLAVGVLLFCLVAGGLLWRHLARQQARTEADWRASLQIIRVASLKSDRKESMNSGRLSPDDNLIVFPSASRDSTGEGWNLWIKQIGGGQPTQVTHGPWHDDSPIWSPNGQRVAFISDRDNQVGIWTVPYLGGEPPTLLKTLEPDTSDMKGTTALKHWSKNSPTIYYSWKGNVYALDTESKGTSQLTNFDPKTPFSREFRISADEEWIAYVDKKDGQYDIWRIPIRGGTAIQVTNDPAIDQRPVWHPDGKRIVYSSKLNGRVRLSVAYTDGRPTELITFTEEEGYIWDVSSRGDKLLYYGKRDESDLWRVEIDTNEEVQLTSDLSMEFWPQVSPDGATVAFQATQGERIVWEPKRSALLARTEASGGQTIQLAEGAFEPQWSPTGDRLAFMRMADKECSLLTVRAVGGEEKKIVADGVMFGGSTIGPPFNRFCARDYCWSPDGGKIAYCSNKDGAPNLWVASADGSGEAKISSNTDPNLIFACPSWSPDGGKIAYVTNPDEPPAGAKQSWTLCVTDLESFESVFQTESVLRLVGWTSAGEVVVATVENSGMNRMAPAEVTLSRISVAERDRRDVARIESAYFANIHLSPDGRNISFVAAYQSKDNIWVLPVEGGPAKKITGNADSKNYYSGLAWSPDGRQIYYGKQASRSLISMIDNLK